MEDISNIKLDFSHVIDCKNSQILSEILHQFDRSKDDLVHKQNIDKIIQIYLLEANDLEKRIARRIFINCFTKFNSKKHTRKYLCETLKKTRCFERIVKETVDSIVLDIKHNNLPISLTNDFMNFVYTNLQSFTISDFEFVINQLFPFYYLTLEIFIQHIRNSSEISEDILTPIHYVLQHELIVLSKTSSENLKDFSIDFLRLNHEILCNPTIKFDMKSKCGLILGYWLNNLPESANNNIKHKNCPILDILDNIKESNDYCLKLGQIELSNIFVDDKMKIVLYSTLYNTVDMEVLKTADLLVETYRKLLNYGIRFTGHPEQIILISRNLCCLIKEFVNVDEFDQIFDETLPFIWSHLEHFIESVCHNIRQLFRNLINLSSYHQIYLQKLLKTLNTMSSFSTVRLNALKIFADADSDYLLKNDHNLQPYLLTVIIDDNMSIKAAEIYIKLLEKVATSLDDVEFVDVWLRPIQRISRNTTNDQCMIYQNIITEAFKMKPTIFQILFSRDKIGNNVENGAFLKCIQYARNNNLTTIIINNDNNDESIWRQLVPKNKLNLFMIDQHDDIRILVLETIIETQKTTEEILDWEFDFLCNYYSYNASTQVPNIRKKIGNFYKKFLNRYQLSYGVILRKFQQNQQAIGCGKVGNYEKFLNNFTKLTISHLGLDSNHPRRSLSLELLVILQKIVPQHIWISLFSQRDIENLKNTVFDSYESNKIMAVTLLSSLPPELLGFLSEDTSLDYFKKCQSYVLDIRPSVSLSASYMFQICLFTNYPKTIQQLSNKSTYNNLRYDILSILLEQLEQVYLDTKDDLLKASQISPLYGLLITIKILLSQRQLNDDNDLYSQLFKQLLRLCLIIKNNIMPVVCNRSPEGNLLDNDDDDYESDETSIAQMILVYSWRTMKEIMLLFNEIVRQTILLQSQLDLLNESDLYLIGDFFVDIFIQSKHRGVFEQAHIAFSSICYNFWRSNNANMRNLPQNRLNTAISFCTGDLIDDRLCSTRRSAGLPFLILSVLTTEPNFANFEKTMQLLLTVVEFDDGDENNIGNRVHSLNVLRFIFINSKIGDLVTAWIDKAMIAALKGFKSTYWGIRNSSTLLFSALITRIFGVQRSHDLEILSPKNRLTISTFNLRYPNLLKYLLKLLIVEADNRQSQILHPILLILARLYPSHNDKTHNYIQEFVPQIGKCLSNPQYRTRDLAGRALVSLVCSDIQIFQQYSTAENNNHGILLQIWHLLKTGGLIDEKFTIDFIINFSNNLNNLTRTSSHTTLSLWMEITTLLLLRITDQSVAFLSALKNIVGILSKNRQICKISTSKITYEWNRSLLLLCILIKQFEPTTTTPKIIAKEIVYCLYSNDNRLKSKCLLFLIYLNRSFDKFGDEHPLFYYENLEIPSTIRNFIDACTVSDKKMLIDSTQKVIKYFIYGELLRNLEDSSLIPTILLMEFYANILQQFYKQKQQQFLDLMLEICDGNDEELICAISTTITSFVLALNRQQLASLNFVKFIEILMKLASPAAAEFSRLTVTQILIDLTPIYYKNGRILDEISLFNLANTVMVLLEDEAPIIRNNVAKIIMIQNKRNWYCMPCKAREEILLVFCILLSFKKKICFLLLWATRQRNLITNDISEIYERGELNQYAENYDIVRYCCKLLNQDFCNLHPFEMTQQIRKAMDENRVLRGKRELIGILGKILDFIVEKQDLRVGLFRLLDDSRKDQRTASMEWFLLNLYQPFL